MKQFKKGLSLFLALALLLSMVYLAPAVSVHAASASDYIATTYAANLSVKTTTTTNLMQYPTTSSTAKYTLAVDTMLTVKALHKNTSGTYWYEVLYYDMTLYVDATACTLVDHLTGDITVTDLMTPAALGYGAGFPLGGTISSSLNKLGTVTASVHYSSNIYTTPAISSSDSINGYSYTMDSSTLDNNLIFSDLAAGSYTFILKVDAISYYIDDNDALATSTQTVVLDNKPLIVTNASSPNTIVATGIDVSVWQGDIDWATVATQVDFAILRIGFEYTLDKKFVQNAQGCSDNGIPWGVYIYSYAESEAEAIAEAEFCISTLKNYDIDLPIFFDIEDAVHSALSSSQIQAITKAFCTTIADAGYQPGLYTFLSWYNSYFSGSYFNSLPKWVAQFQVSNCSYTRGVTMWQYTDSGYVSGISGTVDRNYYYGEFLNNNSDTSYLGNCTYYPSNLTVTINESVNMRQYPSTDYSVIGELTAGTEVHVTGLYKNSYGNYWYQVDQNGTTGYISASYATVKDYRYDDLSVVDPTMADLALNSGYYLKGKLRSLYNNMYNVNAKVYSGEDTLATPVLSSSAAGVNTKKYTLNYSEVCDNLIFSDLDAGYYTYEISADVRNYYVSNGTLSYDAENVVVWTAPFTVGSASITPPSSATVCSHTTVTDAAVAATCTSTGLTAGSHCSKCGTVFTAQTVIPALGHSYSSVTTEATCKEYAKICYTCSRCNDSYTVYADEDAQWQTTKPEGVDESLIETKTQYRYSDYETTTSYSDSLSGYTLKSTDWEKSGSGTINYVSSWPSGFDTSNSLYTKYNNTKKTASITTTEKTTVDSDSAAGYLYYHWCSGTYTTGPINRGTSATKTDSYPSFHAFYSTTNPNTLTAASDGDGSYTYANADCCTDSHWYYYVPVYAQTYTTYKALFTYERWTDYSEWSDTAVTASSTRKVETRTVYRYANATLADHSWGSGVVTTPATCTTSGVRTYTCSVCGTTKTEPIATTGHSYSAVVTAPTCTQAGYTTYTCPSCNDSYVSDYVSATGHSYVGGTCSVCGAADPNAAPFSLIGSNMVLGNDLDMNFFFTQTDISGTDYYVVITHYDLEEGEKTYTIQYADWGTYGPYYMVTLDGLAARQMADTIEVVVYKGNGSQASKVWTDSIRAYALRSFASASQTTEGKTLLVDMLNYGAAAQEFFGYNTGDLANSTLTTAQKAYATSSVSVSDQRTKGDNYVGSSLVLKSRIMLTVLFDNLTTDMYAIVSYTDHTGEAVTTRVNGSDFVSYSGYYGVMVDDLVVADGDQMVTVTICTANGAPFAWASDSMNSYAARNLDGDSIYEMVAKFTTSAYAYFH